MQSFPNVNLTIYFEPAMTPDPNLEEIQRQQELDEREQALRLRELEADLYRQATTEAELTRSPNQSLQKNHTLQLLMSVAKFLGIIVVVVIAIRITKVLAIAAIAGLLGWLIYKTFFDRPQQN
jgi:hypothetical protein